MARTIRKVGITLIVILLIALLPLMFLFFKYSNESPQIANTGVVEELHGLMPHWTIEELYQRAVLVVKGTATGKTEVFEAKSLNGGENAIFTNHVIIIDEVLRGETEEKEIILRQYGGTVGERTLEVDYEPELKEGDSGIFILRSNIGDGITHEGDNSYSLITGSQGFFKEVETESLADDVIALNKAQENDAVLYGNTFYEEEGKIYASEKESVYTYESFKSISDELNERVPIDLNFEDKYSRESLKTNYETGFISKEDYERSLENIGKPILAK